MELATQGAFADALSLLDVAQQRAGITTEQRSTLLRMASAVGERAGDWQRAVQYMREALTLTPDDPFVHLSLFRLHGEIGDVKEAQRFHDSCAERVRESKDSRLLQALDNGRRRYLSG
jgi:Tfp pilus assembly protein PilF